MLQAADLRLCPSSSPQSATNPTVSDCIRAWLRARERDRCRRSALFVQSIWSGVPCADAGESPFLSHPLVIVVVGQMEASVDFEPLSIIGVIVDEVGTPRNDGTAGSALYRVPLRLSRAVQADEAQMLVQLWDRPPSWTSMHRPGIARASGDRLVLDGTTVEEVDQYHAATLRSVIASFNEGMEAIRAAQAVEDRRRADAATEHQQNVASVADRITFET